MSTPGHHGMPNWARILLFGFTCASFVPQFYVLANRLGNTSGISPTYVLFNLIAASELFLIGLFFFVLDRGQDRNVFLRDPVETGDWLNLIQLALVWVLWLLVFTICIRSYLREHRATATTFGSIYTAYLVISLTTLFADAITDPGANFRSTAVFHRIHVVFIAPLVTLLAVPAVLAQAREILARPPGAGTRALSISGLELQTAVFAVLAGYWWPGRLAYDYPLFPLLPWYQSVGFVPVGYAVFALGQAVLLIVAAWHRQRGLHGEAQPLIGSYAGSSI